MNLFINNEIFKDGEYPAFVRFEENKTRLSIINLIDYPNGGSEYIEFEIPFIHNPNYCFSANLCLTDLMLTVQEDKYVFEDSADSTDDSTYALVYLGELDEPGEVYIPIEKRDKITVLKQFNFCGHSSTGETFLDKMYFLKINLPIKESLPLYLSTEKTSFLDEHILLFKSSFLKLGAKNCNTFICLEGEERKNYIALSEL